MESDTKIYSLLYTSKSQVFQESEIKEIAQQAIAFNSGVSITGHLVYNCGLFMQLIESDKEQNIKDLFQKIKKDERHEDLQVWYEGYLYDERIYPNWSMRYSYVNQNEYLEELMEFIKPHLSQKNIQTKAFVQSALLKFRLFTFEAPFKMID